MTQEPTDSGAAPTQPATPLRALLLSGALLAERYRVVKLAGTGGMGEVYKAWDTVLERHVALKAVRACEDEIHLERFRQEAQTLAQLNHPGICQAYDLISTETGSYLTMEWVEGKTLDEAAGSLDPRDRLRVALEAADALSAAHLKGLVHRDLKPLNLMIDTEGRVKILDFGLARLSSEHEVGPVAQMERLFQSSSASSALPVGDADLPTGVYPIPSDETTDQTGRMTRLGFFMGSPRYASPEQIRGELASTPSDVFSLGIVIWELLLGEHPFPGEGVERLQAMVEGRRGSIRGRLPRRLARLLEGMLATRPQDRPTAPLIVRILQTHLRPRTAMKWALLSAAATLLLCLGAYFLLGRGIIADLARSRPARIAVLPALNQTGDPSLSARLKWAVPEILGSSLRGSSRLAVVPPEALRRALGEVAASPDIRPEITRLSEHLGADLYLLCEMENGPRDASLIFRYHLVDRAGRTRLEGQEQIPGRDPSVFQTLPRRAAVRILQAVDPLERRRGVIQPIELPPEALNAYSEGMELMDRGRFQEALPFLQKAATQAPWFSTAAVNLGVCLFRIGDPSSEMAIQWGRWAGRASGNPRDELTALINMGLQKRNRGQWVEARTALDEALHLARNLGEEDQEATVLNNLGLIDMETQHLPEAGRHLEQALALQRRLGSRDEEAQTLNNLAVLSKEQGDLDTAQQHYRVVLEMSRKLGNRWTESMAINNLGDVAIALGRFTEAEALFEESLQIKRSIGHRTGEIIPLANLGILARLRRHWPRSEARLNEALKLCRELKRPPLEGVVLFQLAELERSRGDFRRALLLCQDAQRIHAALLDPGSLAQDLALEAECTQAGASRPHPRAIQLLDQARSKDARNLFVLRTQARIQVLSGQRDEARKCLEEALELATRQAPEEITELRSRLAELR